MVVATYKCNCKSNAEVIKVHKYTDDSLHIEAISNSYAHEIGDAFNSMNDVENYLSKRDKVFGYTKMS